MGTIEQYRCSVAAPGIEVVTIVEGGAFVTTIHGGRLDGERYETARDPDDQHERVCRLVRMTAWNRRFSA